MSEKINEKMPTRGIRMPDELWKACIEMSEELGYGYKNARFREDLRENKRKTRVRYEPSFWSE